MSTTNQDRKIREKMKEKDMDFQEQLRNEMAQQQQNLKGYFKQFKKPIDRDPTKIKRSQSAAVDRTLVLKQAAKPFTLFYTFYEFWNIECATPEENYTLKMCKKNFISNSVKGILISLLMTSFVSFRFRSAFTPGLHALGVGTALMSGLLYGAISSTKFTLEQFQKLGDGYELGRIANMQIQKYRMDQKVGRSLDSV